MDDKDNIPKNENTETQKESSKNEVSNIKQNENSKNENFENQKVEEIKEFEIEKITKEEYINKINEIKNNMKLLNDNSLNLKEFSSTLPQNFSKFYSNFIKKLDNENILIEKITDEKVLSMKFNLNLIKFEEMNLLHSIIQNSLKTEFKSYEEMLNQKGLFQIKHPIQNFFQRNPHLIKDKNYYEQFKDKIDIGKFFDKIDNKEIKQYILSGIIVKTINIKSQSQCNEIKDFLNRNWNNLKNLNLKNLEEKDLQNLNITSNDNTLNNLTLKNCKINDFKLSSLFRKVNKLYCKKVIFTPNSFENLNSIKILNLENCNLIDNSFNKLIDVINPIKETLKVLSLRHNRLTLFVVKKRFPVLEELDISFNKISRFDIQCILQFPKIKLLDLTCNNYASLTTEWGQLKKFLSKGKLCLFFQNMFVMRLDYRDQYYSYFHTNLQLLDYPIKRLSFECFFDKNNYDKLKELNLSLFQYSINSINLSCCNLTDDKIFELLENNLCLFNLKELKLAANEITNKFFTEFTNKKIYNLFPKLKFIDLSSNNINFDKIEQFNELKEFLLETQSLKYLNLKSSSIENHMNDYLKKELKAFYDSKKSKNVKLTFKPLEQEVKNLISVLKNNSNVVIHLKDTLKKEYSSKIKKHFTWLYRNFCFDDK